MKQQHLAPFMAGSALPPRLDLDSNEGRFLAYVQESIVGGAQVSLTPTTAIEETTTFRSLPPKARLLT